MSLSSRWLGVVAVTLLLSGCAMYAPPDGKEQPPKPAWVNLGVSSDGLVLYELDKTSIVRMGTMVDFIDRKTLLDPKNTRHITYQYGYWQMDCSQKMFRLKEVRCYSNDEQLIEQAVYRIEQIPFQAILPHSVSHKQMQVVCHAP